MGDPELAPAPEPGSPEPGAPLDPLPPEPADHEEGGPVTCRTCWCQFGVNPATVPAGTPLVCPVCRTPC